MKSKIWNIIIIILAAFIIFGGAQHFIKPTFYLPFVPAFLPYKTAIIYISGIIEVIIGIALLIPKSRGLASYAYFIVMLIFLPIHVADLFAETPAVGSLNAAIIRLFVQFGLIAITYTMKKIYYKPL